MRKDHLIAAVLGAALAGCGWNQLPAQHDIGLDEALWDPHGAVPTAEGLYVPLPHAGGLALVKPDGTTARVDLGEGRVRRITAAPDDTTVIAFVERYRCDLEHPEEHGRIVLPEDCPRDALRALTEVDVVRDGARVSEIALDGTFNAVTYADDGRFAIAYLDFSDRTLDLSGVVSLTSVVVLDLESGVSTPVGVGFAADQVLFVHDEAGEAERAVVLSRNSVAVVDLTLEVPERVVTFPLTLDPDRTVEPVGVELTPDGRYALISVEGSSDLYALDLESQSINIVDLAGRPAAMTVNADLDTTVLVYGDAPVADVLEHEFFDLTTFSLDEPMNRVVDGTDFALLYTTADGHDVYRLGLTTNQLVEYRLENPAVSLHMAPTEEFAIALTRPESGFHAGVAGLYDASPGMEILDLSDDDTQPFLLEGQGLGVAWSVGEGRLTALVLQERVEYLYQLDMYTGRSEQLELSEAPVAIGSLPDGTFYITHANALGLVSFLDPSTLEVTEAAGFASLGIADPIELIASKEEK